MNGLFINLLFSNPSIFFAILIIVVFSICCHEFMHAYTALRFGDTTAADRGHLTLNPLRQMGITSIFMLLFLGIAWGSVPVNDNKLNGRYAPAFVALSGPITNFFLAIIFAIISTIVYINSNDDITTSNILLYGSTLNLVLFTINLLPIPGLDGWHILGCLFPKMKSPQQEWAKGAFIGLILIVFMGFEYIFAVAEFISNLFRVALLHIF